MLKFTNQEKTAATFNGAPFSLDAPENWASIGDTPTREAVLAWLAEGNTPEPADTIPEPTPAQLRKRELAELSTTFRDDMQVMRDSWLSAFIAGDDETKVQVESDMEDTRLQYVSDKAEITARYSNQ